MPGDIHEERTLNKQNMLMFRDTKLGSKSSPRNDWYTLCLNKSSDDCNANHWSPFCKNKTLICLYNKYADCQGL